MNFRGDLADISAETEALTCTVAARDHPDTDSRESYQWYTGFVVYAPRAGTARCTTRIRVWLFQTVRRSSEFGELGFLWLSTADR